MLLSENESGELSRVRISVRALVEFILRSGDIDNRHGGPADKEAMQEGSRLHRKIQGGMGSNYRAEVPLSADVAFDGFVLTVEGRADGIITGDEVFIDEIKGVYRDLAHLEEPVPVHLAQAKCYAHIYAAGHGLSRIGVQMTYGSLIHDDVRRFRQMFEAKELEQWFLDLVGKYEKWARFQIGWKRIRQTSCKEAEFPFAWRSGQKKLAQDVYRTILRQKKLFIQAPTGTGKTISTVFPAVKAVGEGIVDRIFYATAKTITRTVAEDAFGVLRERGLRMKVLTLTAKEKICFCGEPECNPDFCPYAKGHFDRVNDAVYEMITETDVFCRESLARQAQKWMVCPFEFSLDVSLWADAVICDYNYVFDPRARLKRFFGEGLKGDYLFLIDEAHNLVDRGREMFSAALYKEDFLELKRLVKPYSAKIARNLERCNRYLLGMKREMGEDSGIGSYCVRKEAGMLPVHLMNFCGAVEDYLEEQRQGKHPVPEPRETGKKILDLYFQARSFLDTCDRLDDNYRIYTELCPDGRFMIKLYCIDISENLEECLNRGKSTVYFSATLLPVNYYKSLLGAAKDDYAIYAGSSFDPAKRKVLIGIDTSSRYTGRTAAQYRKMAQYVWEMIQAKQGNYMVFFSSYRMLDDVADAFLEICGENGVPAEEELVQADGSAQEKELVQADESAQEKELVQTGGSAQAGTGRAGAKPAQEETIEVLRQTSGMNEKAREEFLGKFAVDRKGSLVGFCVMGGIFGEGIDLKNDRLIGAVVAGAGLPQVCNEREILKQFYDGRGEDGFFYAYLCPGMNKVLQSAGRVIRTDEDRGVVLLLDERFAQARYRRMFPVEWKQPQLCTVKNVRRMAEGFWEQEKETPGG